LELIVPPALTPFTGSKMKETVKCADYLHIRTDGRV